MNRLNFSCGLVACTVVLLLSGCDESPGNDASSRIPASTDVLRRGNGGDPQSLDPAVAEDVHAFNVLAHLYEGLVVENDVGTISPGVARRWDISDDGLAYTFYLRGDARWSNAEPVTAHDFVAGILRTVSQKSAYSFLLSPIKNYQAVTGGELPPSALGVSAAGDHMSFTLPPASASFRIDTICVSVNRPLFIVIS